VAWERVLVTGGAGFIGTALCRRLVKEGAVVVNLGQCACEVEGVENVAGDIRKIDELKRAARGCKFVFHLAAKSTPSDAGKDLKEGFEVNVLGTINALEAAREAGARLVFPSSMYAYGNYKKTFKESDELKPEHLYGAEKMMGEEYCRQYAKSGSETAIVRFANIYGPGQRGRVIPDLIGRALGPGKELEVRGNAADRRDFVFVDDAIGALLIVAKRGKSGEAYNVGSGKAVEVRKLAEIILEKTGQEKKIVCRYEKKTAMGAALDNSKLKRLGWKPKVPLEKGIEKCVEEIRKGN